MKKGRHNKKQNQNTKQKSWNYIIKAYFTILVSEMKLIDWLIDWLASSGTQSLPIGMPIVCWNTNPPN
jgi:hypothetical protein